MTPQEYLAARALIVRQTTAAMDALVLWELTQSTDLRRYERARFLMQQAFDLESRYGTRVSDVDADPHRLAAHGAVTRVVPDARLPRDYVPPGFGAMPGFGTVGGPRVATMRACGPDQMEMAAEDDTAEGAAAVEAAELAVEAANRHMLEVEQRLRQAHQALDTLPAAAADHVIDRVNATPRGNINPHWEGAAGAARFGAPYDEPPPIGGAADLAGLAGAMGMPHLRPLMAAMQAVMAPMAPDPMQRLAARLNTLLDARAAMLLAMASLEPNPGAPMDVTVLDRQIQRVQQQMDQLEADHVPPNPHPGEIQ